MERVVQFDVHSQNWRKDNGGTWKLGEDVGYGYGWQLLAGSLTPMYNGFFTVSYYLFTDATGAQYHLDQNPNNAGVWSSKESIYVWYDSNVGRLYFRDGSFWVLGCTSAGTEQDAGTMYPTVMEDTNGNQITITYQAGAGVAWTNSSARIATIQDVRATGSGNYYSFTYTNAHLSSITNSLGTAEAYTFGYTGSTLADPFSAANYGATNLLTSMQQTPTTMTTSFNYGTNGSGELNSMTTQYGGSLSWVHSSSPAYSNSRYLREVSSRVLVKQLNATPTNYPITYGSNATVVHASGSVKDPDGHGEKVWTFDTNIADVSVGLALHYNARVAYGTNTGGQQLDYGWTTNASNNPYVMTTTTTQDVGLSSGIAKYTKQPQDQYGNATQALLSNYYTNFNQAVNVRIFNNYYYAINYIRNRLYYQTVTDQVNSTILLNIGYDSCGLTDVPGMPAHDSNFGPTWNTRGLPCTITRPDSTQSMQYDIGGNVLSSTSNGVTTTASTSSGTYYAVPTGLTTNSLNSTLNWSNFLGLSGVTGPNGDAATVGSYDSAARPLTATSAYGAVTNYTYNDTSSPPQHIAITNGHGTRTTYDGFGRTIKVETGTGTASNFTVVSQVDTIYGSNGGAPLGRVLQQSMPYAPGQTPVYTTYTYDGMGRALTKTAPDGSVTSYSYSGNTVTVTDAAGNWKTYTMDSLGHVTQVLEPDPTLGNVATTYTYDVLDHLTGVSMTRGSVTQTRTFNYSSGGSTGAFLLSATNPENGTVTYTYGYNYKIASKVDAKNQKTTYSYDAYNRLAQVQHWNYQSGSYVEDTSQRVNYYYDSNPFDGGTYTSGALGRVAAVTYQPMANGQSEPAFQEWYAYLSPGAVTKKRLVSTLGSSTLNLDGSWTYDNEGKMTSVTYPTVSNHSAKYTYGFDASARPSTMQDINSVTQVSGLSYGPSNELLGITYYGLGETRTYNSRLQLTAITSPWFSTQYAYPATANIGKVSAETNFVTGEQVAYQYDSLQRLINAQTTAYSDSQYPNLAWGQGFVYDGFGNLSQKTALKGSVPTLSVTVDQTTNRVAGTYDQDGNLTSPGGATFYGYDIENRMVAVNNSTFYASDPQNRRVLKQTSSGAQEVYFYGIDGKKLGTYLPTFTGTPYFYASDISVYFGNRRVSHGALQGSTLVFTNTLLDRLNSVRNAGTSGSASSFYPYGEDKGTAAPNDQMKFGTYTRDSASGLDYAMNRYYNSTTGRFINPDVAVNGGGGGYLSDPSSLNQYAYVGGDPVNRIDPGGTDWLDPWGYDPEFIWNSGGWNGPIIPAGVPSDWAAFGAAIAAAIDTQVSAFVSNAPTTLSSELAGLEQSGLVLDYQSNGGLYSATLSSTALADLMLGGCSISFTSATAGTIAIGGQIGTWSVTGLGQFILTGLNVIGGLLLASTLQQSAGGKDEICWEQYQKDLAVCRALGSAACYDQAAQRYAACLVGDDPPPFPYQPPAQPRPPSPGRPPRTPVRPRTRENQ